MKKIISIILTLALSVGYTTVFAEDDNTVAGLSENLNALYIKNNFSQEQIDDMLRQWQDNFSANIANGTTPWSAYQKMYGSLTRYMDQEEGTEFLLEYAKPDFDNGFIVTCLNNIKYLNQYAQNNKFEYALSDLKYWVVKRHSSDTAVAYYDKTGNLISEYDNNGIRTNSYKKYTSLSARAVLSDQDNDFLTQEEIIQQKLLEKGETNVADMQIFNIDSLSLLYIKGNKNDYCIVLGMGSQFVGKLEMFKLYTVTELVKIVSSVRDTDQIKPTYDDEALALQADGLLQGNENGLDLLKPLTRAEAVTLLVRALGLEGETANYTVSEFSDIPSDNWAAPYASLAKAYGITDGVTDTEFAPDEYVTSDQFATFTLRAAGESDFDYTEGTEILIDKGIITDEQAETMDLFTRGDMAKIIYESREKGLM